ncbi:MAG: hypothetical protein PHU70_06485 [Dehalococcoidia bacterium]|nr:hypothetical protein [Dehalococcoidia bacterium]
MLQKFYCPNCAARVVCGERFCGNCGVNLTWIVQPAPAQPIPTACGLSSSFSQETDDRWPQTSQEFGPSRPPVQDHSRYLQKKAASTDGAVTPISKEISKLLSDFEKHLKYSHSR